MTDRVHVKPTSEFEDGTRELVTVDGMEIGVIKFDSEFYALSNTCLHDGGPVCTGRVNEKMDGEFVGAGKPLDWFHDEDQIVISCPWHGWTYDIETGSHLATDDIQLPTYDVEIEDGNVYVLLD